MQTQNVPADCKNLSSEMNSNNVVKHVITLDKPTKIQVVKALQIARAPIQRHPPITPRKCFFLHKEVGLFVSIYEDILHKSFSQNTVGMKLGLNLTTATLKTTKNRTIAFSKFSCMFLNPNNFFQFEF